MKYCDLTFPTPEENLACDEALLDQAEEGGTGEVLRTWEPKQYFVVVGYGNEVSKEVNESFCDKNEIAIRRRCTGGGTVLQGVGVLNYSLILAMEKAPALQSISGTNCFIMERQRSALAEALRSPVEVRGQTDLAISGLKFSGNAQRRRKRWLLFHGSFLLHLDIGLMEKALLMPSKEPCYRDGRSHGKFLTNLKLETEVLKAGLVKTWNAAEPSGEMPLARVESLVRDKYGVKAWNLRS